MNEARAAKAFQFLAALKDDWDSYGAKSFPTSPNLKTSTDWQEKPSPMTRRGSDKEKTKTTR